MRRAARALALLAVLGAALPSCAPHAVAPPTLDAGSRQARFAAALEARADRAVAADAEISVWVRSVRAPDLPGAQARVLLGAPDAFRIRVESAFGTALDLGVHGDSLTAYVPSRRLGMALGAAGESLGVRDPGVWGVKLWSATWRPDAGAWRGAVWRDSLRVVSWSDPVASFEMVVGAGGLPRQVIVAPREGRPLTVRYDGWAAFEGVQWPVRLALEDEAGEFAMTARVHRVRFGRRANPGRLRVSLPDGAERITLARLKGALARMEEL